MSLQAVSKHLKVLERAGLITRVGDAEYCRCRFEPEPLDTAIDWIARHRQIWEERFYELEQHLSPPPPPPPPGVQRPPIQRPPIPPTTGNHLRGEPDMTHTDPTLGELTYTRIWERRALVFRCMLDPSTSPTSGGRSA